MLELSRIKDRFYISATSSAIDPHRLAIKSGETFGVFDRFGDILPIGKGEQGLYHQGTRFISRMEFRVNGLRPLLLSSWVDEDNLLITIDLTNADVYSGRKLVLPRDSIHIMRSRVLCPSMMHEYIRFKNFSREALEFGLEFVFDCDFSDIFEVRGLNRKHRGKMLKPEHGRKKISRSYLGLDGIKRETVFEFPHPPLKINGKRVLFNVRLKPGGQEKFYYTATCLVGGDGSGPAAPFEDVCRKARRKIKAAAKTSALVETSNEQFNAVLRRADSDIEMMITETDYGLYPFGGIPWYSTPFGRDGIVTALECLWLKPAIARGVLHYLSMKQAQDFDKEKAAEPGKILHETRKGELANLGEIPFGLYYGSVDSTPLYLMLAGAYWRRTGDSEYIKKIWGHIELALLWMDNYGDLDGDGFLEYARGKSGLVNQGWKDSTDSVFHADGSFPDGPIALPEVQGYMYAAKREVSALAGMMGKKTLATRLINEAEKLKERFNKIFWDPGLGTYVLALDGDKNPCRVLASNAGHALYTGIAQEEKARKTASLLVSEPLFSGWGIRTLGAGEVRYNPMSYHNGSVWPHDNALIASGLAQYGFREEFVKVFSGLFSAALFMEYNRLPELFCGFHRRPHQAPTLYPVACAPQTWASGALIQMLQAALGIEFEPVRNTVVFRRPVLPEFLDWVSIRGLRVCRNKSVDMNIRRFKNSVTVEMLRKSEGVDVVIFK